MASCAPGHSLPHGPDTLAAAFYSLALPELASLPSCLGTCRQRSSNGLERGRSNISPTACPGWFCSLYCCSPGADEVEAISAVPQQWQPEMAPGDVEEVDLGGKAP